MLLANKHFSPVVGIDIHIIVTPVGPIPIPHPFIGMVMDVMDYIPFIGSSVKINSVPRGICDTSGIIITLVHIPMGGPFLLAPMVGHESVNFFGSTKVKAEDVSLSPTGYMLMTCNDIGIPLSLSPGKKMKPVPSLFLPTSMTIPLPLGKPVMVGGPYAPDLLGILKQLAMSYGFGAIMKGLGKGLKKLASHMPNIKAKFTKGLQSLKCKFGFEPVDLITGRMVYEGTDFELPGIIPICWTRNWYSDSSYEGPMGHGMHHSYDLSLFVDAKEVAIALIMPDGRPVALPYMVTEGETYYDRTEKLSFTCINNTEYLVKDHNSNLTYTFKELRKEYFKPVRLSNQAGFALQFVYDHQQACLTKIIDTAGRVISLTSDKKNRITSITAQHRGSHRMLVNYTYDDAGDLVAITDALDQSTTMRYNNHLMVAKTDRNGQTFYWEYDGSQPGAKCIHTWGDGGLLEGWIEYKAGHNIVTNSLNESTIYYFNEDNLCTQETDPLGNHIFHEYTPYMEPYRDIDEEGNFTGYTYDDRGNLKTITQASGAVTTFAYDAADRLMLTVHPQGDTRVHTYRPDGLLLSIIAEDGGVTSFIYNELNLVERVRNNKGQFTSLYYDEDYNLVKMVLPDESNAEWKYDVWGRCIEKINAQHHSQVYAYDELDRVTRVQLPDHNVLKLAYDAYDEVVQATDKKHNVHFEYTPLGSLKMREQNGVKVHFKYNTEEQLTALINEHGEAYKFNRNAKGDIIKEQGFDGLLRTYIRDRAGKVIKVERPGEKFTIYEYDMAGRITRAEHSDGTWEMYSYNLNGQLIEGINQNSTVKLIRDKSGRVEKEDQDGYTVQSSYNDLGFRQHIKSSLGANIALQHNIAGLVSQVDASQQNAQWQATIHYNSLGQEVERNMGMVISSFSYDFAGRVKEQTTQAKNRLRRHKQYEWGINDKLHKINDILNRTSTSFEYDQFDNLVQSMGNHLETENFFRDDVGNIFKTREKKDRSYSAGGKLLSTKENKYQYDDEGNLIKKHTPAGDWLYEWAGNGMLQKVTRPDAKQVSFEYDALGRRTAKIFSPASRPGREPAGTITRWVWDGNTPLHEWKYDIKDRPKTVVDEFGMLAKDREEPIEGLITWIFDEGSFKPAAKMEDGETYSIINDYLGTPCEAYNKEGEKIWEAELNSSGKIRKLTGQSCFIPFRYQGQYEDEETGLYYNRFRYYSAEEGMYVSQDPIRLSGGNPTFYSYVKDSNVWVDELGMDCSKDALKLRANMLAAGHTEPGFDNAAHHIVMSNSRDKRMQDVRKKMEDFGIDINSPENGIFLPKNSATKLASGSNLPAHSKIHTNAYKQNVYDNLINTKSPEEFLENLAKIKGGL